MRTFSRISNLFLISLLIFSCSKKNQTCGTIISVVIEDSTKSVDFVVVQFSTGLDTMVLFANSNTEYKVNNKFCK
jgi:hypothetical protein